MIITAYSEPACVQSTTTTRTLEAHGLDYSVIDLTKHAYRFTCCYVDLLPSSRGVETV